MKIKDLQIIYRNNKIKFLEEQLNEFNKKLESIANNNTIRNDETFILIENNFASPCSFEEKIEYFKDIIIHYKDFLFFEYSSILFRSGYLKAYLKESTKMEYSFKNRSSFYHQIRCKNHFYLFWILKQYFPIDMVKIIMGQFLWTYARYSFCYTINEEITTFV